MKYFIIFFITLFTSCEYIEKRNDPKPSLSEEQLIAIIVDFSLSDSMVETEILPTNKLIYQKKLSLYSSILEKHGTTEEEFQDSYEIYSEDLVHLSEIYDKVLEELSKKEIELKEIE